MHSEALTIAGIVALLLFGMYRRFRRFVGRQRISMGRMGFRIVLASIIGAVVIGSSAIGAVTQGGSNNLALLGSVGGLVVGAVVAWFGLKLTKFEDGPDGKYYTPNVYIGMGVFAIFLVRMVYRFVPLIPTLLNSKAAASSYYTSNPAMQGNYFQHFTHNPLTAGAILLLFGYYIFYYLGVLLVSHQGRVPLVQ